MKKLLITIFLALTSAQIVQAQDRFRLIENKLVHEDKSVSDKASHL
jgi:hypothetical protein